MAIISVTERATRATILLNADHILMARPISSGGSTIYLACGSLHHPDILTVAESVESLSSALKAEKLDMPAKDMPSKALHAANVLPIAEPDETVPH